MQYRRRPYLAQASKEALEQRLKDIMNNMATLTPAGKIGLLPIDTDGIHWMTLFTHVLEEYTRRNATLPALPEMPFPRPTGPDLPKSALALEGTEMPKPGKALIKLGKRTHMTELFEFGCIRVAPAGSYSDPSLNYAVSDDELKLDRVLPGSEVTLSFQDQETGEPRTAKPISDVTITTSLESNFYVYCMTDTLTYRLFDDFEADACVIIHDPATFQTRFLDAMEKRLPEWADWNQAVEYIDPYLHQREVSNLAFSKHFRYWYQREYRFAWMPEKRRHSSLAPIFVQLGSLDQISELVCL
ncbi:MAG: hypothetical protein OXI66_04725 [Boseongicola sp.]|nr:hypothetical protein [Boseongicola sp.]